MNAVIKITGVQGFMQPDAETIELMTEGVYCRTEDGYQVYYTESEITGLQGTTTSVFISPDGITVERRGMLNSKWCSVRVSRAGFYTKRASARLPWALTRAG